MLQIARNLIKHTHLFKISKMPPKISIFVFINSKALDSNSNENV